MFSDRKTRVYVSVALFLFLSLTLFLPIQNTPITVAAITAVFAVAVSLILKKKRTPSIYRKQVLMIMTVIALVAVTLYFMTGLHFGFVRSIYRFSASNFFKYILPLSVTIIAVEIIRGVLLAEKGRLVAVFAYLSCFLAELLMHFNVSSIRTFHQFMDAVGLTFLPAIAANLLYCYLVRRYGVLPNIFYRLICTLYPFVFTALPNTPDILYSFARIMLPILVWFFISLLYEKQKREPRRARKRIGRIVAFAALLLMTSTAMILTGKFSVGMLVIGSGSMEGELRRGDAILYRQEDPRAIEEGDILVFQKGKTVIVHRVVEIERINGETRYYTKGDANEAVDSGYVTEEQILGTVELKLPYLGYPSLWLRSNFER